MKTKQLFILTISCLLLSACGTNSFSKTSINSESSDSSTLVDSSNSSNSSSQGNNSSEQGEPITPPATDSKWNVNFNEYGIEFRNTLKKLMDAKQTTSTSYKGCLQVGASAAAYPNANSSTFVPFYHGTDTTTTTGSCNREHCWPNSRGGGLIETDPFIIRPTLTSDNSSRGNDFYGNEKSNEWDPASLGFEAARGESARIILYAAARYYDRGLTLSNNPSDSASLKTMGTFKTLIKWNLEYPVTQMEKQINNYLSDHGYGRNPFVDHPEYAQWIWNENGYLTSAPTTIPGGNDGGDTPEPELPKYNLVNPTNVSDLSNKEVYFVTSPSATGTYFSLTSTPISEQYPWYLSGIEVSLNDDKSIMSSDSQALVKWKIEQTSDGKYRIHDTTNNLYLYNYIDGTHYSIGVCNSLTAPKGDIAWNITANGKGYNFIGTTGVALQYYKSFSGYNGTPSVPMYLYE